jgi:tRNA uridine 5-carbamoylmethylation protein Kti12
MAKLVVLSGVPGSGKSYFSNLVKEKKKDHCYIVSSDALRKLITGHQQDLHADKVMWKMFYELPKIYANDKDSIVILDSTSITRQYRIDTNIVLKQYYDEVILVFFDIPKDIIDKQNLDREFPIPQEAIDLYYKTIEFPNEKDEEFFDKIYSITPNNFLEIVDKIIK